MYVFICSAAHSGSTLLDLMLGAHSRGLPVGEVTHLPKNIALRSVCSCGDQISGCSFWKPTIDALGREMGVDLWRHPYRLHLGFIKARTGHGKDHGHQTRLQMLHRKLTYGAEYLRLRWNAPLPGTVSQPIVRGAENKRQLFDLLLKENSKSFVVDSSKHYLDAFHLHRVAADRTRIILLVRDGRAVFYSGIRRGRKRGEALAAWTRVNRRALALFEQRLPPSSWIKVHYEDLADDPQQELDRICRFLGVAYESRMLRYAEADHHLANGNDMRLNRNSTIRVDDRWRSELTGPLLAYFDAHASGVNRKLGYS